MLINGFYSHELLRELVHGEVDLTEGTLPEDLTYPVVLYSSVKPLPLLAHTSLNMRSQLVELICEDLERIVDTLLFQLNFKLWWFLNFSLSG